MRDVEFIGGDENREGTGSGVLLADTRLMAEALREQIEQGAVTGRAALLIGS